MLAGSLWRDRRRVGFSRASSNRMFRAVLRGPVIPEDLQGHGLGRQLVESLLGTRQVQMMERVYLMTTNSARFIEQLGFQRVAGQQLLHQDHRTTVALKP